MSGRICKTAVSVIVAVLALVHQAYAGGLDSMRFKHGMVYGLTDLDQRSLHTCCGNLFGLEDDHGRVILPPKYSDIEYCGHGIFLATDVQESNKYYFGDKRHFFNRQGKELRYSLPRDAFLLNILSFGRNADQDPNIILNKLPSDTILLFGHCSGQVFGGFNDSWQGLCNLNAKVLMAPIHGTILFLEPGSAFVMHDQGENSVVSLTTWASTLTNLEYNPGTVPKARIPLMPFPKDRSRTVVKTDNGQFDHNYWCEKRDRPIAAIDMFNRFLHEYNLIGMLKGRVAVLLGEPDPAPQWAKSPDAFLYRFPHFGCVPYFSGIKIYMKNDNVVGWSFIQGDPLGNKDRESEQITSNVVLQRPKVDDRLDGRLVNARIGETKEYFPSVEPKQTN